MLWTRRGQGKFCFAQPQHRHIYSPSQPGPRSSDDYLKNRDTFVGNYAAECTRQRQLGECDISKAIARACKAAARTIGRLGAQEAIPWAEEIDR